MTKSSTLPKPIQDALSLRMGKILGAPTNLFDFSISGLETLKYKKLAPTDEYANNDIIRVAGKKDEGLFCVIENAKQYRISLKTPLIGKQEVYRL